MKKIYLSLFLLFSVSILGVSQNEKWRQKNARINFVVAPEIDAVKVAGTFSPVVSVSGLIAFNNTYFAGLFGAKKALRLYNEFPVIPGVKFDANYQYAGVEFMYSMKLGLYRTKGGHYVMRKMRLTYDIKLGGGVVWLDDESKTKVSAKDYFYMAQPAIGVLWPINDFMTINGGINFTATYSIDKLDVFFSNKDFLMAGAFVSLRVNLFR